MLAEAIGPFLRTPPTHEAGRRVPDLSLHQPGSHCLPCPGDSLKPQQICCFWWPFHTNCPPWLMLQTFLKSLKVSQTTNKQHLTSCARYLLLSDPRTGTSSKWLQCTACPLLSTSKPSLSGAISILLCNSCLMTWAGHTRQLTLAYAS